MSFGFQFDDSEMDEEFTSLGGEGVRMGTGHPSTSSFPSQQLPVPTTASATETVEADFKRHSLEEMLRHLPSRISYSSVQVELDQESSSGSRTTYRIPRRDLFDARFQMLLGDDDEDDDGMDQDGIEHEVKPTSTATATKSNNNANFDQNSDLIPGVYEGGLKTWECALDLVDTLHTSVGSDIYERLRNKHVLELGCGTAIPTLFLLGKVFDSAHPSNTTQEKINLTLHLADYNSQVLNLVTLPNLILVWWTSKASASFRQGSGAQISEQERQELRRRGQDHFDTSTSATSNDADLEEMALPSTGELSITSDLLTAFVASLQEYGIQLQFYSGSWSKFPPSLTPDGAPMDLILTSETIYSLSSLPTLIDLLRKYSAASSSTTQTTTCLVAAKVIYFGVGGGVEIFKQHSGTSKISTVKSVTKGVGRVVLSVEF